MPTFKIKMIHFYFDTETRQELWLEGRDRFLFLNKKSMHEYNRVVLIGNGFDKSLGLKTSYSDFVLRFLKDSFNKIGHNQPLNNSLLVDNNIRHQRWTKANLDSIENSASPAELFRIAIGAGGNIQYPIRNLVDFKFDFFKRIVDEFSGSNVKWVDVEEFYFDVLNGYYKQSLRKTLEAEFNEKIVELNKCVDALTDTLSAYLSEEVKNLSSKVIGKGMVRLMSNLMGEMNPDDYYHTWTYNPRFAPNQILFLNFNYTNTLESIPYLTSSENAHINYIHGNLYDKNNPPIFGYGDDTYEDYLKFEVDGRKELLRKIKTFHYPKTHNYRSFLGFINMKPFEVFIVGHSCGTSDKTMLKTIFEHPNCRAIKNFHYRGEPENFEKTMAISRIFQNKAGMRSVILPFDASATMNLD